MRSTQEQLLQWQASQQVELSIWERTSRSALDVLAELRETVRFVEFARGALRQWPESAIEIGIGSLGVGWASVAKVKRSIGVDSLPKLESNTGLSELDALVRQLASTTEYLQLDAGSTLPFSPGSFDVVVCNDVLDQTADPVPLLLEANRLVAPEGHLLLGLNVFSSLGSIKWHFITRRLNPKTINSIAHPYAFTERQLIGLLRRTGWEIENTRRGSPMRQVLGRSRRLYLSARSVLSSSIPNGGAMPEYGLSNNQPSAPLKEPSPGWDA